MNWLAPTEQYIIGGYYFLQKDSTYGASLFVKSNAITQVEFRLKRLLRPSQ